MSTFSGLLILALVAALWVNSMRAREIAMRACSRGCQERGVQLLDQTVELSSIRLHAKGKLRLRRVYRFDFSERGVERYNGHVTLIGNHVVEISLGLPTEEPDEEEVPTGMNEEQTRSANASIRLLPDPDSDKGD
jgi:hypothetical protein